MNSEFYGTITLDVSIPTRSIKDELGVLETNYEISNERAFKDVILMFVDVNDGLHTVKVHNWDVNWERFFDDEG
jgi:hypothetical protein